MTCVSRRLCLGALALLFAAHAHALPGVGEDSKQPLPRFVALKADEVNVRTGPGTRYPIRVVFKKKHYPVQVVDEFDYWRRISDGRGNEGWVHKGMLTPRRTAVVKGKEQVLTRDADPASGALLRVEGGVLGNLRSCRRESCRLEIEGIKGWIAKKHLWGVLPEEVFE